MEVFNFRNWLDFTESTHLPENQIPKYFYVSPKFTKDIIEGPKPGITPSGCVATLMGLEGISDSQNIMTGFWSTGHMGIQMPGKECYSKNKIVKVDYDNADMVSSMGLRTIRRLRGKTTYDEEGETIKADGGYVKNTTKAIFRDVITSIISSLEYNSVGVVQHANYVSPKGKPGGGLAFVDQNGNGISPLKIVDVMMSIPSKRAKSSLGTEELPPDTYGPPGLVDKKNKMRSRHAHNNLKNIRNASDFTNRFFKALKILGAKGIDRLMNPGGSTFPNSSKPAPKLYDIVKRALSEKASGYQSEHEWILRRVAARNSNTGESVIKPMLHVPQGSKLYLGNPYGDIVSSSPWLKKEKIDLESKLGRPVDNSEMYKLLAEKYKLWRYYDVHFVDNGEKAKELAQRYVMGGMARIYNPEKLEMIEKVKDLVEKKGIKRVDILARYLKQKENMPPEKFYSMIDSWKRGGQITVDGGLITFNGDALDEDTLEVMNYIKGEEEGARSGEIAAEINMPESQVQEILDRLTQSGKLSKGDDEKYSIAIPPEELATTSREEEAILKYLQQHDVDTLRYADFRYYGPDGLATDEKIPVTERAMAVRKLKAKNLIYQSKLGSSGYWKVRQEPGNYSEDELKVIEFLKDHPNNDVHSLQNEFDGTGWNSVNTALSALESKGVIKVGEDGNSVTLNTKINQPNPGHKQYSKLAYHVIDAFTKHFLASTTDLGYVLASGENANSDYARAVANSLLDKGILVHTQFRRIVPAEYETNFNLPSTPEEEKTLQLISQKPYSTFGLRAELKNLLGRNITSDTAGAILRTLKHVGKAKSQRDLASGNDVYHSVDLDYKPDISYYEKQILEKLQDGPKQKDILLPDLYDYSAKDYIFERLVEEGKIKVEENFVGRTFVCLPNQNIPSEEESIQMAIKVLGGKAHMLTAAQELVRDKAAFGDYDTGSALLEKLESSGEYKSSDDGEMMFPKNMTQEEAALQLAGNILGIFQEKKVMNLRQIEDIAYSKFNVGYSNVKKLLDMLVSAGKLEASSETGKWVYYIPGTSMDEYWKDKIYNYIKDAEEVYYRYVVDDMYYDGGADKTKTKEILDGMIKQGLIIVNDPLSPNKTVQIAPKGYVPPVAHAQTPTPTQPTQAAPVPATPAPAPQQAASAISFGGDDWHTVTHK